jgi:preprotein translocase subunit SecD
VKSRGEAVRRQTIAERKQAELAAAAAGDKAKPGTTGKEGDD